MNHRIFSATVSPTPLPRPTVTERPEAEYGYSQTAIVPQGISSYKIRQNTLSSDISGKLYDILINDIGFSDADFYGKVDNWRFRMGSTL